MATGYKIADGRDLDDLFGQFGAGGVTVGYKTSNGVDLGSRYFSRASSGITTDYKAPDGRDLGAIFGRGASVVVNYVTGTVSWQCRNSEGTRSCSRNTTEYRFSNPGLSILGLTPEFFFAGGYERGCRSSSNTTPSCGGRGDPNPNALYAAFPYHTNIYGLGGRAVTVYINGGVYTGTMSDRAAMLTTSGGLPVVYLGSMGSVVKQLSGQTISFWVSA